MNALLNVLMLALGLALVALGLFTLGYLARTRCSKAPAQTSGASAPSRFSWKNTLYPDPSEPNSYWMPAWAEPEWDTPDAWIEIGPFEIHLRTTDEGVVVDTYAINLFEPISSNYLFFGEGLDALCEGIRDFNANDFELLLAGLIRLYGIRGALMQRITDELGEPRDGDIAKGFYNSPSLELRNAIADYYAQFAGEEQFVANLHGYPRYPLFYKRKETQHAAA